MALRLSHWWDPLQMGRELWSHSPGACPGFESRAEGFTHPGRTMRGWVPVWSPGLWMPPATLWGAVGQKWRRGSPRLFSAGCGPPWAGTRWWANTLGEAGWQAAALSLRHLTKNMQASGPCTGALTSLNVR